MKSSIYQLGMAHKSIFEGFIKMITIFKYKVRSNTDKRRVYTVQKDPSTNKWICNCKGFGFNGHCSHITTLTVFQRTNSN